MSSRIHLSELVAAIPHMIGYQPTDDNVALLVLDESNRILVNAVIAFPPDAEPEIAAEQLAEAYARMEVSHAARGAIIVAYGPEGEERALKVDHAIHEGVYLAPSITRVRVHDNQWQASSDDGRMAGPEPIPVAPDVLRTEGVAPAARREDIAALYAPLPTPTFEELPGRESAILDRSRPALKAEIATRVLDTLAESPTPKARATLAHLTNDTLIRDVVITTAMTNARRRQALIDTFRCAPPDMRPRLATAAAAAMYFGCEQTPRTEAVLAHAEPDANLTALVEAGLAVALDPRAGCDELTTAIRTRLHAVDRAWAYRHSTNPGTSQARASGPQF